MKLLVDEMYEGYVKPLQDEGYEVESVKQLINQGKKMHSDYSVLSYAKEKNMILVTADLENQLGCEENEINFVPINKDTVLKTIIDGIRSLQK